MKVGGRGVIREKEIPRWEQIALGKGQVTWARAQRGQGGEGCSLVGAGESSGVVCEPFLHQPGALVAEG